MHPLRWPGNLLRGVLVFLYALVAGLVYGLGRLWLRATVRDRTRRASRVARWQGRVLRRSMTVLGATFIKMGQVMSSRPDLFAPELIEELRHLQDRLPAFGFWRARRIVEQDLAGRSRRSSATSSTGRSPPPRSPRSTAPTSPTAPRSRSRSCARRSGARSSATPSSCWPAPVCSRSTPGPASPIRSATSATSSPASSTRPTSASRPPTTSASPTTSATPRRRLPEGLPRAVDDAGPDHGAHARREARRPRRPPPHVAGRHRPPHDDEDVLRRRLRPRRPPPRQLPHPRRQARSWSSTPAWPRSSTRASSASSSTSPSA